ncbi:hypothetical protein AMAG_20743 [Allomyces macrogynus ATCC 38327]|uniref:Uncharacterized protein n=1 Tax=Allomyces macrogynus (strain ATCC 38327) TaxID=578462 RepID=A0A0L0TF72_ALLM3|nr:hypothetical protein AMAG_20743 [Allomyces macrogynus ATCC 38327]|eukprot:KNE73316.1 hypothetical protein AMAG_20743 [Allomyces macrogynus ATCC 38327]
MPARDLVTVASDASHPATSGGVVWKANFATLRDQLFLTSLVLQGIGFLFLLWTTTTVLVPAWCQNKSRFWHMSLVGTVLLLPVPLFEMAYALARLTGETIWPFPSYLSITSDVLLRTGYTIILLCRFFRLKIVSP